MRTLRDHAQPTRYVHNEIGFNYRMDGLQGAVLRIKLNHLPDWDARRRDLAVRYRDRLAGLPLGLPAVGPNRTPRVAPVSWSATRTATGCERRWPTGTSRPGLHYPTPVHLQQAYAHLGYQAGDFPVTEAIGRECLSLPLFPEMTDEQQDAVVAALKEIC